MRQVLCGRSRAEAHCRRRRSRRYPKVLRREQKNARRGEEAGATPASYRNTDWPAVSHTSESPRLEASMDKFWLRHYRRGCLQTIDVAQYRLAGRVMAGRKLQEASRRGVPLHGQGADLRPGRCRRRAGAGRLPAGRRAERGDRVAIMMPNVPQYPVAVAASCAPGWWWSASTRCTRRASSEAPAEGLGREGDRHHRELAATLQKVMAA